MSQENGETLKGVVEELDSLRIAAEDPSSAAEAASSPVSNGETNSGVLEDQVASDIEQAVHMVDHALRDALCNAKNRAMVLQLETDVSWFVVENQEPQFIFTGEMSSYQRLLAHRVAQHWGLDTSIIQQGPDQGRILATRTPRTGPPQLKLAEVPISLAELTSWPSQQRYYQPGPPGAPGPIPRVLVRRRPERGPMRRGGLPELGPSGHKLHFSSNEDRELVYARARARIFASSMAGQQGAIAGEGEEEQAAQRSGSFAAATPAPPQDTSSSPEGQETSDQEAQTGPTNSSVRKAQLRNKQEDLADPDFKGRARGSPWYEGYGEPGASQGVYLHPTFSGEYSEVGGAKSGGTTPHTSPSTMHSAAVYSSPYPTQMVAVSPYHMVPGQGMVAAGPPHLTGGVAMYTAGPGGGVSYAVPSPAATAAYLPMSAYGFVPVHSRGDAEGVLAAAGAYGGMPLYGSAAGSPMGGAAYAVPSPGVPAYPGAWQGFRPTPGPWAQQQPYPYSDRTGRGGYYRQGRGRGRGSGYSLASGSGRVFSTGTVSTVSTTGTNEAASTSTPTAQTSTAPQPSTEGVGENTLAEGTGVPVKQLEDEPPTTTSPSTPPEAP